MAPTSDGHQKATAPRSGQPGQAAYGGRASASLATHTGPR